MSFNMLLGYAGGPSCRRARLTKRRLCMCMSDGQCVLFPSGRLPVLKKPSAVFMFNVLLTPCVTGRRVELPYRI